MLLHFLILAVLAFLATADLSYPAPMGTYIYKTVGNLSIQADVYVPNITLDKYPVVLAIHGGGFVGGSKQNGCSPQELVEMLSRGWCVVSIDYRLSPSVFLDEIMQDVQDAYAWIRTELVNTVSLDLDSFIVLGGSAGGGLAVTSGYMLSPRPQAIIAFYPGCTNYTDAFDYNGSSPVPEILVSTMDSLISPLIADYPITTDPNDPRGWLFALATYYQKVGWMITTDDPNEAVDSVLAFLQNYSAVYHINSEYPPTVFIHGLNDTLVPYEQSVEMAGYLGDAGVPYELNLVPGAGHAFDFENVTTQVWDDYILPAFDFAQQFLNAGSKLNVTISQ